MALKALSVFQGEDWMTYRWSVAGAHDALDSMLSLSRPDEGMDLSLLRPQNPVHVPLTATGLERIIAELLSLCDDFQGAMDMVMADLGGLLSANVGYQWKCFEIMSILRDMKAYLATDLTACRHVDIAEPIGSFVDRMRDLLNLIDQ